MVHIEESVAAVKSAIEEDSAAGPSVAPERVVLLADDGTPVGSALKSTVHDSDTALHLAFSCHVFNEAGEVLVTRRSLSKRAWAGVWTNAFCGHPLPGEEMTDAITRRASFELGLTLRDITVVLPNFRYRATDSTGIVENEICPVFVATAIGGLSPNPAEAAEFAWTSPLALQRAVSDTPFAFSPWLALQLSELDRLRGSRLIPEAGHA